MTKRRADPDVDQLWGEFHERVNMSGHELRPGAGLAGGAREGTETALIVGIVDRHGQWRYLEHTPEPAATVGHAGGRPDPTEVPVTSS